MTIIGIEEHWTTPGLTDALRDLPAPDESLTFNEMGDHLARLHDIGDGRIAAMDEQGIDMHVLSLAPPATGPLAAADATAMSRELNDHAAAAVARHPTRLRALCTLPMAAPDAVVPELQRVAELGFVGVMVYGRTGDTPLDDPCYEDLFEAAAALRMPVFIHPQIPSDAVRAAQYSGLGEMTDLALATFSWGWHLEAALAALRLIARGTLDRYPDLHLILGHWGELLPLWSDRTDSLARVAGLQRKVSEYLRSNVYLTCSGMLNPVLLRQTLEVTGIDRLMFSTDYPFQHPTRGDITTFLSAFASDEDRAAFTSGNARRLLGIDRAATQSRA